MPEAIWPRMAETGKSMPIIVTICSIRRSASRAVLAWTVVIEPSWPVFIACSMSKASRAAHLADDDPVGPHPQRVAHQVALGHRAVARGVRRPGLQPHDVLLLKLQLGRVLDRDDPLARGR